MDDKKYCPILTLINSKSTVPALVECPKKQCAWYISGSYQVCSISLIAGSLTVINDKI